MIVGNMTAKMMTAMSGAGQTEQPMTEISTAMLKRNRKINILHATLTKR